MSVKFEPLKESNCLNPTMDANKIPIYKTPKNVIETFTIGFLLSLNVSKKITRTKNVKARHKHSNTD